MKFFPLMGKPILFATMVGLLVGCSGGQINDLDEFVLEVKASKKGRVEPLPEFIPTPNYNYAAAEWSDPFVSWNIKMANEASMDQEIVTSFSSLRPDTRRRREPMENYPLDTLRMVGTMEREGEKIVLVRSPEGLISRINVGNYMGQNHGRVTSIGQGRIELSEIVPDGLGGWIERSASLALVE